MVDFRDFSIDPVRVNAAENGLSFLVIDTKTPHELTDGGFAVRRAASESCAQALGLRFCGMLYRRICHVPGWGSVQRNSGAWIWWILR